VFVSTFARLMDCVLSFQFRIGDNRVTTPPPGLPYSPIRFVNLPLTPNTAYVVAVGAKTSNTEITVTNWSARITTGKITMLQNSKAVVYALCLKAPCKL